MSAGGNGRFSMSDKKRALLDRLLREENVAPAPLGSIPRRTTAGPTPLSFAQERLWFLNELPGTRSAYNFPASVRLRGPLNAQALETALNEIVRRHEALRTSFPSRDGTPAQVVAPELTLALPVIDLSARSREDREAELARRLTEASQRPYDLARLPLVRAALLRFDREDHAFLLNMHHIVTDGWSVDLFNRELATLYETAIAGGSSPLSDLPIQYPDFAVWQRERMTGDRMDELLAYWRQQLSGAPAEMPLPVDRSEDRPPSARGGKLPLTVSAELAAALQTLAQREGVTLYMTLLAGLSALLRDASAQDDIVVGSPIAGRTHPDTRELIGFFVNTLVLRADLSGNPTYRELLQRVRQTCIGAFAHQEMPFEQLVARLRPRRAPGRTPLVRVLFALQETPEPATGLPGLESRSLAGANESAKFDLMLYLTGGGDGLSGWIEYRAELFEAATVERIATDLRRQLETMAEHPDRQIGGVVAVPRPSVDIDADSAVRAPLAPRNDVETRLAEIWEALLNVSPIGVRDNFFGLGGHSLMAMRLLARIEKAFGVALPAVALFEAPTIEELALLLRPHEAPSPTATLAPLRAEGDKTPFFWVHGDRSNPLLPKYIDPDRPIYGLVHEGQDGRPMPHRRLSELVEHYLREMRSVQPHGPYLLGGYCFGGLVAFEMAQRLAAQQEAVSLLFELAPSSRLVVKPPPVSEAVPLAERESFAGRARNHAARLRSMPLRESLRYVSARVRGVFKVSSARLNRWLKRIACRAFHGMGLPLPVALRPFHITKVHESAAAGYEPRIYHGRVVICLSADDPHGVEEPWGGLAAPAATVHRLAAADHLGILEERHVRDWSRILDDALATASADAPQSFGEESNRSRNAAL